MTQPTTTINAILAVMRDVEAVAKREKNVQQGFNFRGIDAVINAVGPAFRKHGLIVLPQVEESISSTMPLSNGKSANRIQLRVTYRFIGEAGDEIATTVVSEAFDQGDKATAKAMSVALRTALLQVLCLPTDDRDPDHDVYETAARVSPIDQLGAALLAYSKDKTVRKEFVVNALGKDFNGINDLTEDEASKVLTQLTEMTAPFTSEAKS